MKKTTFTFLYIVSFISISLGQDQGVIGLLSGFKYQSDRPEKSNCIETTYVQDYEETSSLKMKFNEEDVLIKIANIDSLVWQGKDCTIYSIEPGTSKLLYTNTLKFNDNGQVIFNAKKFEEEPTSMMNEDNIISYDDKGRVSGTRLVKTALNVDNENFKIDYDDDPFFPSKIKMNFIADIFLTKKQEGQKMRYDLTMDVESMIESAMKEMPEFSKEQVIEGLGSLAKPKIEYCLITKNSDGSFTEEKFKEDDNKKVNKESTKVFDSKYRLLSKSNVDGSTIKFTYTQNDKVLTYTNESGETFTSTFDLQGRPLTEYSAEGYKVYEYKDNRLHATTAYNYGSFSSYITYRYK